MPATRALGRVKTFRTSWAEPLLQLFGMPRSSSCWSTEESTLLRRGQLQRIVMSSPYWIPFSSSTTGRPISGHLWNARRSPMAVSIPEEITLRSGILWHVLCWYSGARAATPAHSKRS